MILLLGVTGYVGEAFEAELRRRGWVYRRVSRSEADYTRFDRLRALLAEARPEFVVNCAGYTGKPNVDACEAHRADTLLGNTLLPQTVAQACEVAGVPWGHVSSGCIYSGARVRQPDGTWRVEKDLTTPEMRAVIAEEPGRLAGFREEDPPNFSFRYGPCSFYSGTKALGEEAVLGLGRSYLWRLRIPFDGVDNARNYLSKVQRYAKVYDNANSISHRGDFAKACLDCLEKRVPFGLYNVTNPGWVTTRQVVELIRERLRLDRTFEYWTDDAEFYRVAVKTPRSNCLLDMTRLTAAGIRIRPVDEALDDSLRNWVPEGPKAKG